MAASRVTDELTALEQMRSRLEAELGSDEHWRALTRSAAQHEEAETSAARRARNTRLKMALAENPLYHAWKHLGEAIDALRESGADAERPAEPGVATAHAAGEPPVADVAQANTPEGGVEAHSGFESPADVYAEPPRKQQQAAPHAAGGSPSTPPPLPRPGVAMRAAELDAHPRPRPHGRAALDGEEATVTFVRREPLLPSALLPADLGTERASALFERLRGLEEKQGPATTEAAFAPPNGDAEEAEVTIVSAEGARVRREAEARADTIRRLRKALSGD